MICTVTVSRNSAAQHVVRCQVLGKEPGVDHPIFVRSSCPFGLRVAPPASRPEMALSPPPPAPGSLLSGTCCPDGVGQSWEVSYWDRLSIGASSISRASSTGSLAAEGEDALLLATRFGPDVELGLGREGLWLCF